ncbi:MAG: hypothetical protein LUD72_07890 [Bacteroidales bacterium]|nr:hypothetical protein [Bacteroidales bacterium]
MKSYLEINEVFVWDELPTFFTCMDMADCRWYICSLHHVEDDGRLWCVGARVAYDELIQLYRIGGSTASSMLSDSDWYGWVVSNPDYPFNRFEKVDMNDDEKLSIKMENYFGTEQIHGNFYFDGHKSGQRFSLGIKTDVPYGPHKREFEVTAFRLSQVSTSVVGDERFITLTRTEDSSLRWHENDDYFGGMASSPDDFESLYSRLRYVFWMCGDKLRFEESGNAVVIAVPRGIPVEISVLLEQTVPNDYDQEKYKWLYGEDREDTDN